MKWLLLGLALSSSAFAARPRTVMVQLFEWPWPAVGEECEKVLGPAGYAAVQISPPQEHVVVDGAPWWERYQPVSYRLESRSGTEEEFAAMVKRCNAAGVDVYADVVLNHMAAAASGTGFAGTSFTHYEYNGLWQYGDFHHCGRNGNDGLRNFQDLYELQNCELLGMADLNTGSAAVQAKQAAYLNHLLDLGVKGFRVDAAKHIAAKDLLGLFARVTRPHYNLLELILTPGEPVKLADYLPVGDVNDFAYAYALGTAFHGGDLSGLPRLPTASGIATDDAVVFLENHDLERRPESEGLLAHHFDPGLHRLGMIFLLTWPYGYPAVFSGYDFTDTDAGPPVDADGRIVGPGADCAAPFTCLHREAWLRALVDFRNRTNGDFAADHVWSDGPTFSFGRGEAGHVVITLAGKAQSLSVPTGLAPGRYANLVGEGTGVVDKNGVLHVDLAPRSAFVALDSARVPRR